MSMFASQTRRWLGAIIIGCCIALPALVTMAEEPVTASTAASNPSAIDRDGKHICGFDLMTDSERGGHRAMLHGAKTLEERDAIRVEHCKAMRKRAQERGVEFKE